MDNFLSISKQLVFFIKATNLFIYLATLPTCVWSLLPPINIRATIMVAGCYSSTGIQGSLKVGLKSKRIFCYMCVCDLLGLRVQHLELNPEPQKLHEPVVFFCFSSNVAVGVVVVVAIVCSLKVMKFSWGKS